MEEAVVGLTPVHKINIRGYVPQEKEKEMLYLRVETCTPNVVAPLRSIFEREARILNVTLPRQTFESNIPYALRFMVDKELAGMSWFKIAGGKYSVRSKGLM